jgi:hypothetical protein
MLELIKIFISSTITVGLRAELRTCNLIIIFSTLNFSQDDLRHDVWVNRIFAEEDEESLGRPDKESNVPFNKWWQLDRLKKALDLKDKNLPFDEFVEKFGDKKKPQNNDWLRYSYFPILNRKIK